MAKAIGCTVITTVGDDAKAGKAKELTPIYRATGLAAKRLLFVGLGPRDKADYASLLASMAAAAKMISSKPTQSSFS